MRKVLVIDDYVDAAESLSTLLAANGYQVSAAEDGWQGLAIAGKERPDAILLDIKMPRLDGYGFCRRLRAQPWAQATLVIAISGMTRKEDYYAAIEAGCDHYFAKPVEIGPLVALIEHATKH